MKKGHDSQSHRTKKKNISWMRHPFRFLRRRHGRPDGPPKEDERLASLSSPPSSGLAPSTESSPERDSKSHAQRWLSSFYRSDPRFQLHSFFQQKVSPQQSQDEGALPPSVFTVWRPTSKDAIQRMIAGDATGKGLEIKGKSAKSGALSGYVPFLQIHQEQHKSQVKTIPRDGRVRIYYEHKEVRDAVVQSLEPFQDQMLNAVHDAKRIVKKSFSSAANIFGADLALATVVKSGQSVAKHAGTAASFAGEAAETSIKQVGTVASSIASTLKADTVVSKAARKSSGLVSAIGKNTSSAASSITSAIGADGSTVSNARSSVGQRISIKGLGISATRSEAESETEWALKRLLWDCDDASIRLVDTYAPRCYGIELPERLLWQAFVIDRDISRPEGSKYYTGRPSQPAFQDMNLIAIYKTRKNQTASKKAKADEARVVLWHHPYSDNASDDEDLMDPRCLIMAYEEHGRVLPVVSDFDCFTIGTRGFRYEQTLPKDQVELLQWCLSQIEDVLERQDSSLSKDTSWTSCWLEVLKSSAAKGFHPDVPRFGFGDGKSYSIIESAVTWLKETGAVRHGAECFNYYFPQEMDTEFLIVSDTVSGKVPWKYVGVKELQDFLTDKISEGFTFPLNPKWVLCDEGWKEIYDRLSQSDAPDVQDSLDVWFPRESGVRESMQSIHGRHPDGFVYHRPDGAPVMTGTEAMDLATLELEHFLAFRRAKAKLRAIIAFNQLLKTVRAKRVESTLVESGEHK